MQPYRPRRGRIPVDGARWGRRSALDDRLRVYYDGSPTTAIDMGTLLATHWGAGSADTSHSSNTCTSRSTAKNYLTAFLVTFPIPFGTSIKIAYFNAGQAASIYSMVTYSTHRRGKQANDCATKEYANQKLLDHHLAQISRRPGLDRLPLLRGRGRGD